MGEISPPLRQAAAPEGQPTAPMLALGFEGEEERVAQAPRRGLPESRPGRGVASASPQPYAARATSLLEISAERRGRGTVLHLRTDGPIEGLEDFLVRDPDRLVLDLPGVESRLATDRIEPGTPDLASVRIGRHPGKLRVVLEAPAGAPFEVALAVARDGVWVGLGDVPTAEIAALAAPAPQVPRAASDGGTVAGKGVVAGAEPPRLALAPPEPPPVSAGSPDDSFEMETLEPLREDGLAYRVSDFQLRYGRDHADLPPLEELLALEVELGRLSSGYVRPREGIPRERVRLADATHAPQGQFYASAIIEINERIVAELNRRDFAGVLVVPDSGDVDLRSSRDLRPPERSALRLVIWTGQVLEYRTIASGERAPEGARIDHPANESIKRASPVQPGDLPRKRGLDEYVARLNRHPGRRVAWALSPAWSEPGGTYLDYLVAEDDPLALYVQGSNNGTDETSEWRERFGLVHTQLTGRDDVLKLDYITGDFDEVNAFFSSYELPVLGRDWLRWRLGGSWAMYDATQLGFQDSRFEGEQWDASTQLIVNVWQREDLFFDVFAGLRYQDIEVDNDPVPGTPIFRVRGRSDFFLPELGLRLERVRDGSTLRAALSYEWNVPAVAGTETDDLEDLGRLGVDEANFETLRWDVLASAYLEPLLGSSAFADSSPPSGGVLAHEVAFSTRGQYAFGNRLAPQYEQIAGGFFTVRGYPQSVVAGDTVLVGSAEYRFHLPRILPVQPVPARFPWIGEFRVAPQRDNGRPDWDLILRAFVDAGRTKINGTLPGEEDETLIGAGLGIELQLLDTLMLRFDWGRALRPVRDGEVREGSHEYHFMATLVR